MSYASFFAGKRVTQLGLGLLGRGIKDADFLARHVDHLTVTDKKSAQDLATSVQALAHHRNITFVLGEHRLEDFESPDFVLKAAGVPLDSPYIAHAREKGIPVFMDESLFLHLAPPMLDIGVTGTRGKTTTTSLIHHCLAQSTLVEDKRLFLGGNIQDTATLPFLEQAQEGDVIVSELSSWQLQGYGDLKRSPHIAVFTNLFADHLPYYDNNMRLYFDDKAQIFRHQSPEDFLICTPQLKQVLESYAVQPPSRLIVVQTEEYKPFIDASPLLGDHNHLNIACAVAACRVAGMNDEEILAGVRTFAGVAGRLERIQTTLPFAVYNDTTSTTPDALGVALDAFAKQHAKHVVLIMGGADKNLDFTSVYPKIQHVVKTLYLTPGAGSTRLLPDLKRICEEAGTSLLPVASTAEAVRLAKEHTQPQDILLFSPGCSSFAEFANEYDRGTKFLQWLAL